jgi:aldehyde dehydrogenase (NAD+)
MVKQFEKQFIGGEWKLGNDVEHVNEDKNPYTQETLLKIQGANTADVDEAYQAARKAQKEWMDKTPQERSEIVKKAVGIMKERQTEIIEWLIKEGGATKIKAGLEVRSCQLSNADRRESFADKYASRRKLCDPSTCRSNRNY